ncbi:sigma-70 family RNA polymerase sigma factor [bacterium]|nr:sigma-70 family RNA polymerase sigma factor [bacterium]MCI0605455.1 sigma-70 family RNA polymerase sigma factor [bacterium]
MRLTRNPPDSNDLVQDTVLRAYQRFSTFTEGTNCKSWLFTIMYSIFVNQYRKKQREAVSIDPEEIEQKYTEYILAAPALSEPDLGDREIENALTELPDIFRILVILVDVEGFTYEEAARILDCPVGTIRSRLFRARKMLYVSLKEYAQKMGYEKKS